MIQYSNRPFSSVEEMDAELIRRWNEKVGPKDRVYHLGDFSFHNAKKTREIRNQLNGEICLILGNHDKIITGSLKGIFSWVKEYYELSLDSQKVVLCHFPLLTWNKCHYGSWHLHGHCHGSLNPPAPLDKQRRMDIGVDTNPDYAPYSWDQVKSFMETKETVSVDHHQEKA